MKTEDAAELAQTLFEEIGDAAFIVDPETNRVLEVNPVAERLTQLPRAELLRLPLDQLFRSEGHEGFARFQRALYMTQTFHSQEGYLLRRGHNEAWTPINVTLTRLHTELRSLGLILARDIRERKQAEEKLRLANTELERRVQERTADLARVNEELEQRVRERTAELEATNKELEAFSYSVSHDLRAPLRAIDGFSRIVLKDYGPQLPKQAMELLNDVRANAQQMGQLVDDLLTFARLNRQSINCQLVLPDMLVRRCLEELRGDLEGRSVDLVVDQLPACQGDPALLKQVWANLLANAVKYTRKKDIARIEVGGKTGREHPAMVTYFVKDNGVGFDMRYAHKLFGVFQRLHRAEEYEGTGVGLATVQRIVQRHGGRVWTEARPGEGATFFFTLRGQES